MAKKASGSERATIDAVAAACAGEGLQEQDIDRLWAVDQAFGDAERTRIAAAVLAKTSVTGAAAAWLRVLATDAPDEADVRALAELATRATRGRVLLARIIGGLADHVEPGLLAAAVTQLEVAAPFAPLVLGPGRTAVRACGDAALADRLDARQAFIDRHAELVRALDTRAKEKHQEAATAWLDRLGGDDRVLAATWVLTAERAPRDATRWARRVAMVEPAIAVVIAADALNESFIHDDEEQQIGEVFAAAGPAGLERATDILEESIARGWANVIEHLAPAFPAAFATPRGFAAVVRGFAGPEYVVDRLCEEARKWVRALAPDQAAQIAELLIPLADRAAGSRLSHAVGRAFFYFENPGGLATFAAALERDISDVVRDEIYEAIENIPGRGAQDVLIERLFSEQRCLRDLVYAVQKACMPDRHADFLAKLDARPSHDAAWVYIACQMHWSHRPRHVADVIERVLAWPDRGDPGRRASMMSQAVVCALELRRYELAARCLAELGDADECVDPTERDGKPVKTVLADRALAKQLARLRSGELLAEQQAMAADVERLRVAGTPRAADDDRLGMLAGGTVQLRLFTDPGTHEVWFFDREDAFFYYDGYGIAPPPFELAVLALERGWDAALPALAAFCADWRIEARSLHRDGATTRELLRSGERVTLQFLGTTPELLRRRVFGLRFPDTAGAERAFAALDKNPMQGYRAVDPFYVAGKQGGTWARVFPGTGEGERYVFVVGSELGTGAKRYRLARRPCGTHAAAVEQLDAIAADFMRRGVPCKSLELLDDVRPLDDMPLQDWMTGRERDDDESPGWHLEALRAIRDAMVATQLPLDVVDVELGPPASADAIAAYEATLPEPLPEPMRQMWSTASTARWRVGEHAERLLSPAEVLRERASRRAEIATRIAADKRARKAGWEVEHLDVLVVRDDASWIAFDVRQEQRESWYVVGADRLEHHTSSELAWMLAECFASDFVDALIETFPAIKKLKYGQSVAALQKKSTKTTKTAKTAKAAKTTKARSTKTKTKTK